MLKYQNKLAKEIYNWCKRNGFWEDTIIYFNGKAWSSSKKWHEEYGKEIESGLYEYQYRNPKDYFEYVNDNMLSMSFEGLLYDVLNEYVPGCRAYINQFHKLFEKYDLYYELGDSWNLTTCKNYK